MARFYQQVKTLIFDIERFLTDSIKDSKLPKKSIEQKSSILSQIRELRNDYPQLETPDEPTPPAREEPAPTEADPEEIYEDTDSFQATQNVIPDDKKEIPASDTTNVKKSGQLKIKKDKKGNLLSKLAARKCYCVLREHLFYVYDKKTSKKQNECFTTEGYQVTLLEDEAKKEYGFEMTGEDKKSYIFEAASQEDLQGWMAFLYKAPAGDNAVLVSTQDDMNDDDAIEEDLYEETDNFISPTARSAPIPSASESPPPVPKQHPPARGVAPPALPARTVPAVEMRHTPPSTPKNTPDDDQDIYDETCPEDTLPPPPEDDQDDIYDETGPVPEETTQSPQANKSSLFSSSLQQQSEKLERDSPHSSFRRPAGTGPTTPPKKSLPPVPAQNGVEKPEDYANMFYGVWDCAADQEKELSFSRGDVITVVDRKYDDKGWWVGRLQQRVGLVPKGYLSPAYERA